MAYVWLFLGYLFYPFLRPGYHRFYGTRRFLLYGIAPSVIFIIYFIIKTIFAYEYGIKRLKMRIYLLNHLYKIRAILAVRA